VSAAAVGKAGGAIGPDPRALAAALAEVDAGLAATTRRPLVLGICGTQASGKSTLARAVVAALIERGIAAAALSLDDLYRTRAEREGLARDVHPLLLTRGVPGTHDVALGHAVITALERGEPAALPRFAKPRDDRAPAADWPHAPADCQVLVFEGWCVGAWPQDEAALAEPVNALEHNEDADGRWRRFANAALCGEYAALFARLDRLLLLAAPGFEAVFDWRREQELRDNGGGMDDAALRRFIAHYERLTRHMLATMPAYADRTLRLDNARRVVEP
jgi:D-glycerate 3-kinase